MGRWWKNTVHIVAPQDKERKVTFAGDSGALGKKWPILWRFCQNWHILKVAKSEDGFRLFFQPANGPSMEYRWPILKDYVAVRVGPEKVTFWAVCERQRYYTPLKIVDTGLLIPGLFRKDRRHVCHQEDADQIARQADFV